MSKSQPQSQSQTKKIPIRNLVIFIVAFLLIGVAFGPNIGQVYTGTSATGSDTVELTNDGNLDTKVRDFSLTSFGVWTVNGEEYSYRKLLTINANPTVLTNYQPEKTIAYLPAMQLSMADMRFTTFDGINIPYYEESVTAGTEAVVRFKIPSISNTGDTLMWMYYGNPDVSSASSVSDVYIQYTGSHSSNYIGPLDIPYQNVIFEGYGRKTSTDNTIGNVVYFGLSNAGSPTSDDSAVVYFAYTYDAYKQVRNEGSYSSNQGSTPADTSYHTWKVVLDSDSMRAYVDDVEQGSALTGSDLPNENMGLIIRFEDSATGDCQWLRARQYTAIEPTWAADGAEQRPMVIGPGVSVGDDKLYYDDTLSSALIYSDGSAYIDTSDVTANVKGSLPIIKVGTTQNIKIDHGLEYSITYIPKNMDITSPDMFRADEDMRIDTRLTDTSGNPVSNQPLEMRARLFDSEDNRYLDEIISSTSFVIPGKYIKSGKHYQLRLSYNGFEFGGWSNEILADFNVDIEGFIITSSPDKAPEGLAAASFAAASNMVGMVGMAVTGWLDIPIIGDIIKFIADLVGVTL